MRFTATGAWDWWRGLNPTRFVAAPMVDQSELAFRMLCRELGVGLCYTPMLHARLMTEHPSYKKLHFDAGGEDDRPLFGQLAGHDPQVVLSAARLIEDSVSAVDLNFGCPQAIARKGRYGAFLLEEPDVPVMLVETLARELSVPVTAKVRILPSGIEDSIELCLRMQDAGAAALCVHGRTRTMNKQRAGAADWNSITRLVEALDIPVIANGGVACYGDAEACLEQTGAAAIMSSEALLENPALFCSNIDPRTGAFLDQDELARRYLQMCERYPPSKGLAMSRGHVFKLLHHGFKQRTHLRDELLLAQTTAELAHVCSRLQAEGWEQPCFHREEYTPARSWYWRHRHAAPPHELHASGGEAGDVAGGAAAAAHRSMRRMSAVETQDAQRLVAGAGGAVVDEGEKALQRRERKKAEKKRRRKRREEERKMRAGV